MLTKKDFVKGYAWWLKEKKEINENLVIGVVMGCIMSWKDKITDGDYAMSNIQEIVQALESAREAKFKKPIDWSNFKKLNDAFAKEIGEADRP